MSSIINIEALEILDSRGYPTVEVSITISSGKSARASIPSGASKGIHECPEKRDHNERYHGLGVRKAIEIINSKVFEAIVGCEVRQQAVIDTLITEALGNQECYSNISLPVSLAVARVAAKECRLPLYHYLGGSHVSMPIPYMNVINGGAHANNNLDIQEFMIVPWGFSCFEEALRAGVEIYHTLKKILIQKKLSIAVGDEGGFSPSFSELPEVLDILLKAITESGYQPGSQVSLALDCATSSFYRDGIYHMPNTIKNPSNHEEIVSFWSELVDVYPIISLEDAMAEDDWEGWSMLTKTLSPNIQIVGDDLFVTHVGRLSHGIEVGAANAILIKMNQIGTLTAARQTISLARQSGYAVQVSHRSGETEDSFIADLAVAISAGQIKTGAPCRSERTAKYNQLLRISGSLASTMCFPAHWRQFTRG